MSDTFRHCPCASHFMLVPNPRSPFPPHLPSYLSLLLLLFSHPLFNFFTPFNSPLLHPLAFYRPIQCSFAKKSRGSQGDVVSLCKCHFVSSERRQKEAEGKSMRERVHVERCHSLLCPFRLRKAMEKHQEREREEERKRQRGLMVSDTLGDSSKICLPAA